MTEFDPQASPDEQMEALSAAAAEVGAIMVMRDVGGDGELWEPTSCLLVYDGDGFRLYFADGHGEPRDLYIGRQADLERMLANPRRAEDLQP